MGNTTLHSISHEFSHCPFDDDLHTPTFHKLHHIQQVWLFIVKGDRILINVQFVENEFIGIVRCFDHI